MRGQTSLPALGIALLLLVTTTVFGLAVADGQLAGADREAVEQRSAVAISDRLVAPDAPPTVRENVLGAGNLERLAVSDLRRSYGLGTESAVRVTLDGATVLESGDPSGGTTVERIVLVENRSGRTIQPRLDATRRVTLPRRSPDATLGISPSGNATVWTVRADEEVLLHDSAGLGGTYDVALSRYETATLAFEGSGSLQQGDVVITYHPAQTRKARLGVTVQRWGDPDG